MERLISRTIEKSGIRTIERQTELQNDHGKIRKNVRLTTRFRKFFDTQLIYADVRPAIKEMFMGHSIGLDDHYFKPSQRDVLEEYMTAVDYLTISEENKLKMKVKELTKKQDEIKIMEGKHNEEIQAMRDQMSQILTMLQHNPKLTQVKPTGLLKNFS